MFVEVVPSQHGLSDQMEEAVKEWFTVGPHDKVNYDVNIMTAQGPLGMPASRFGSAWLSTLLIATNWSHN